ncbi:MAG: cell division transport system ATP-binding protein [Clostridia bacterium]|nr:cell division transport system ATP-binding protein [Clostridia bacterium]
MEILIQFFNVTKKYDNGTLGLDNISVSIDKGEFVFLVGPSGAGKSTFTRLLIREALPTKGQIMVDGKSIVRMKQREIPHLRRKIGFIFQDFRLLQDRTVYENVAFALEVMGTPVSEVKRRVPSVLELVGIGDKYDCFPEELSGGEQQRVAIARAIVNNPSLLIADEPTGNLDPDTSLEIMKIINNVNKRGTTIVMATHDSDIVNRMRKRVIVLNKGTIVRDDVKGGYNYGL